MPDTARSLGVPRSAGVLDTPLFMQWSDSIWQGGPVQLLFVLGMMSMATVCVCSSVFICLQKIEKTHMHQWMDIINEYKC